MNRYQTFRLLIHTGLLLGLLLTACAAPLPVPTSTLSTATLPATATPLPTASPALAPTATPISPTVTPAPTVTPTPGPGDILIETNFDDLSQWNRSGFSHLTYKDTEKYTVESQNGGLYIEVPEKYTVVHALYNNDFRQSDVQIDVDVEMTAGPNRNHISLLCRHTAEGWYEFAFTSGGLWFIYKNALGEGYTLLASGASTAINMQKTKNHLTLVCQGDMLTFYINDVAIHSTHNTQFVEGTVGMGASTFNISGAGAKFDKFVVRVPDPANPPGGAVAPTLTPSATSWWAENNYDGRWRGTTSQGKELEFTVADGSISWFQVGYDLPDCSLNSSASFGPGPVSGDEVFLITADVFFSGAFTSADSASGTLTIHPEACPERTINVTWSASK